MMRTIISLDSGDELWLDRTVMACPTANLWGVRFNEGQSRYPYAANDGREIAQTLADLLAADGIAADDQEVLITALRLYASHGMDFADAMLAARRMRHEVTRVYCFDRDFDRLPCIERLDPGAPTALA